MVKKENMREKDDFYYNDEIDLLEYIRVICKRKKLVFGFLLISLLSVFVVSYLGPRFYESSVVIQLAYLDEPLMSDLVVLQELQKESLLVEAIKATGVSIKPEILKQMMEIEYIPTTNRVNVKINHTDSHTTVMLADRISQIFVSTHRDFYEKQLLLKKGYIAFLEKEIASTHNNLAEIDNLLSLEKIKLAFITKEFNDLQNLRLQQEFLLNDLNANLLLAKKKLTFSTDYGIFNPARLSNSSVYKNIAKNLVKYVSTGLSLVFLIIFWQEYGKNRRRR